MEVAGSPCVFHANRHNYSMKQSYHSLSMHKSLYLLIAWALASLAQTYPPVPVSGTSDWASAVAKAKLLVAQMTTAEKVNITAGGGWQEGPCVGNTRPVPRLNFQSICLQDSPLGVRYADLVSAFPAGINAAATWDRTMIYNRGVAIGQEFRGKGVNVALGPMMNMGRVAAGGRNWEGFGADPYLTGEAAAQTIQGIQSIGVIATAKHYIGNEQEHSRGTESSNIDDRTAHEIYLYPFAQSVKAGVGAVMCSYNQLNGTYACENDHSLNLWLKGQLGFQGFVMSDWDATHSGVKSALAGLDMDMPGDTNLSSSTTNGYFISTLASAVQSGSLPQSQLDDMVTRILASWYKLGQDQGFPAVNFNSWNGNSSHINVQDTHKSVIRQLGAASTVLLKNLNNVLPLNKPRSIAIIGSDAGPNPNPNEFTDRGGVDGTLAMGWGSGTVNFPYLVAPIDALQAQASNDSTTVTISHSDTDIAGAISAAEVSDIAIVFGLSDSGEGYITVDGNEGDRNNLSLWNNVDQLVQAVAGVNKNTIVVVHSVGPVIMPWATNPNVTAIVWAGIPGQESGNALVDVLYGAYNPSGRLPYTIAKQRTDYSADVLYNSPSTITYSEGLYIDYRWFDYKNIQPQYEFGFGLSYTTFNYSEATANVNTNSTVTVTLSIMNNGNVTGNEVAQLYLGFPASAGEPPKVLKGFQKISLIAGQSSTVTFQLTSNELSIWDSLSQSWIIPNGSYTAFVGASSRDIRTTVTFNINGGSLSSSPFSSVSSASKLSGPFAFLGNHHKYNLGRFLE